MILSGLVPPQIPDNCDDTTTLNCGPNGPINNNADIGYKIEFPRSVSYIPLAGGTVLSIGASGLKLKSSQSITGILTRHLSLLQGQNLPNTLKDLSTSRLLVNNGLFEIARKDIKIMDSKTDEKRKAPSVYLSIFRGEDKSVVKDDIASADLIKILEFRYIPVEAFSKILNNLNKSESDFRDVVGVSGRTFAKLEQVANKITSAVMSTANTKPGDILPTFPKVGDLFSTDPDIVDLVLEFFPIINIDEEQILSENSNPVIGGYYTIMDNRIYMKLPDLSGRNSAGEGSSPISEDDSLWIEVLSGNHQSNIELSYIKPVPLAKLEGDNPDTITPGTTIQVSFSLAVDEPVTAYLSPVLKSGNVSYKKLKTFSNALEIFSVPVLTEPLQSDSSREPTISESSYPDLESFNNYITDVKKYYPNFTDNFKTSGLPYLGQEEASVLFGEMNRPEILLSEDGKSNANNDKKYFSLSSYSAIDLLTSIRPKIYYNVPAAWPSANASQNADGIYVAIFNIPDYDLSALNGSIEFVVYIKDHVNQITKVIGPVLKLSDQIPVINSVNPNGFNSSGPILADQNNSINIIGENLDRAREIKFNTENGTALIDATISSFTGSSTSINFNLNPSEAGMSAGNIYEIYLQGVSQDLKSNIKQIYIADSILDSRPNEGETLARFNIDEFKGTDFGNKPIVGIPIFKNGSSAQIKLKSKSNVFNGESNIFLYLAVPSENKDSLYNFEFKDNITNVTLDGKNLSIPLSLKHTLEKSIFSDFYKDLTSNKKAIINFPGNKYSGYNLSKLINMKNAYFILCNRQLDLNDSTLSSEDFSLVTLGGDDGPAFIEASTILGTCIELDNKLVSTFKNGVFNINDKFNFLPNPEKINVYGKINKIGLIVAGIREPFLNRRYKVSLGGIDISKKITKIKQVDGSNNQILIILENVVPLVGGLLEFTITKNEKNFGSNYTTNGYYGIGTACLSSDNFTLDSETNLLNVSLDLDQETFYDIDPLIVENGFINSGSSSEKLLEVILPDLDNDGFITNPLVADETIYAGFNNFKITSDQILKLRETPDGDFATITSVETSMPTISKFNLGLNSGVYSSNKSMISSDGSKAFVFFNVNVKNINAIKYNVPEPVQIAKGNADFIDISLSTIPIEVGETYRIKVKNTERDFIIKFNDIVIKPKERPTKTDVPGEYIAIFEAPLALMGISITSDKCFDICISTDNLTRNNAKFTLGRDFVIDIDNMMDELLNGKFKDKIPDVQGLIERLADAPLRFVKFILDKAAVPKDLIKSFCDYSFHLLAELKISLNGFQILMIPIQVIFCIIDVICSLLNPIKVAKAVIRLFQCLYDLILLLPQISIPVMLLQLILHLLELIQCVIDKILFTITAINEISRAINLAARTPINFAAIKALEETLSEYLFEIETDLSFLEPILSILGIFLQLLQLVFRFPCNINPSGGEPDCGVDGSLLAGIVAGIAAPDLRIIPSVMLPVCQSYSTDQQAGSTETAYLTEPAVGTIIAEQTGDVSYLASMNVAQNSLRSREFNFNATMAPTFTKSTKKAGRPNEVEFHFKGRGLSTFLNVNNIDLNQTVDTPIYLSDKVGDSLKIAENGNIYSPIDGQAFLNINGNRATVKPLILTFEVPIYTTDSITGLPVQTGTDTITRTFDNIPKMVIMDDEFNVYFIKPDGIKFNNDGAVDSIEALIVNTASAPKLKFSKEDVEIDEDDDDTTDEGTIKVFDFPQLYFFDMRQAGEQLQQFCSTSSINSFPFEDNNTEDITRIVESTQGCLSDYLSKVRTMVGDLKAQQLSGKLPLSEINTESFASFNDELISCLNINLNDICKYAVNSLNTSFKVLDDNVEEPLPEYSVGEVTEDVLESFQEIGPEFTGAREYAAGIGDSANIIVGNTATIEIIPRDAYDEELRGDFSERIILEIISDTTQSARFIKFDDIFITKNGNSYYAKVTADNIGEVRLRASICDRTIQALTFDGIQEVIVPAENDINCVPGTVQELNNTSPPLGALTKVDRILSIFFIKDTSVTIVAGANLGDDIITNPQQFGTRLEN